jgi:hypothetical protein
MMDLSWFAWMREHDLPNWISTLFAVIVWPLALFWWSRRKVNSVPRLLVSFTPRPQPLRIGSTSHPAVDILFENQTASVVYVNGPRIRNCTSLFPVPTIAVRDIGENAHPLSFVNPASGNYEDHQATLQTSGKVFTTMATTTTMSEAFYHHRAPMYRRLLRAPRYFIIEYTAMVGEKKYSVRTIH